MKIGIITWFNGSNYGTNLQAIALQNYLRRGNHDARIINYEINEDNRNFWDKVAGQPQKYLNKYTFGKYAKEINHRDEKLVDAMRQNCVLTKRIHNEDELIRVCNEFDLLICGGDQIWNPNWYNRFYYADYDEIKTRRISYAPSLGVNSIPKDKEKEIIRSVQKFDAVSVRESKGAELLFSLIGKKIEVVADPAFLLNEIEWREIFPEKRQEKYEYVLSMFLTDQWSHWQAADRFAKEKGMRHIVIPYCGFSYLQKADIRADAGLNEVLDLIRGAEYVLTDSFHITVFSLIHRKQFFVFQRFKENRFKSTNERVLHLLRKVNSENRFLAYGTKYIEKEKKLDYAEVDLKLDDFIKESKFFLKEAMGEPYEQR